MFFNFKKKYQPLTQIETNPISYMVKFWLENSNYYLTTSKDKNLNALYFKTSSILADFLSIYELNKPAFSYLNDIETVIIQIRDKTIILNPIKKYRWYVYLTDKEANQKQYILNPTELGLAILSMFSVVSLKNIPDPDIIMAICYYYEQMSL
jgi:hypothetical protein